MDILTIALIVLVVAGIWLLVELAISARRIRPVINEAERAVKEARPAIAHADELIQEIQPLVTHIDEVVTQIEPVVSHVDEAVTNASPALTQVDPLLVKTSDAVGALSDNLRQLEGILSDVSRISDRAGSATIAVSDAATNIANKAKSAILKGRPQSSQQPLIESHEPSTLPQTPVTNLEPEPKNPPQNAQQTAAQPHESETRAHKGRPGFFTYPAKLRDASRQKRQ